MFIYFWERQHEQGMGREKGRHRNWSRLQALSCQHRAWHGAGTHKPWDHDLSRSRRLNQLSHPGTPKLQHLYELVSILGLWRRGRRQVLSSTTWFLLECNNPSYTPSSMPNCEGVAKIEKVFFWLLSEIIITVLQYVSTFIHKTRWSWSPQPSNPLSHKHKYTWYAYWQLPFAEAWYHLI